MAQTNAPPQKLTGSAGFYAEGQSTDAKQIDVYFDDYRFRSGETIPRLRLHYATLARPTATRRATSTMPFSSSIGRTPAAERCSRPTT